MLDGLLFLKQLLQGLLVRLLRRLLGLHSRQRNATIGLTNSPAIVAQLCASLAPLARTASVRFTAELIEQKQMKPPQQTRKHSTSKLAVFTVMLLVGSCSTLSIAAEPTVKLRVFPDCKRFRCDWDFMRSNLSYVDLVRDPKDADVHVLMIKESYSNGDAFNLRFIGQNDLAEQSFRSRFDSPNTNTDDMTRRGILQKMQLGLIPFLLNRPESANFTVTYNSPTATESDNLAALDAQQDPWNAWVFRSEVGMQMENEDRQDESAYWGSFSANRTTDAWRMGARFKSEEKNRSFILDDGSVFNDDRIERGFSGAIVKSFGDNWGAAIGGSQRTSTFRNLDNAVRLAAAVEYNLYPYQISAEKALTLGYFMGFTRFEYQETSVLGLDKEERSDHGLFAEYDVEQPWGGASLELKTSQFLDDTSLYRVTLRGNMDYRITRGLSINLWGRTSLTKDQIYLAGSGTSDENLLLGNTALDTGSESRFGLSLKYTFGSIYNNAVNNRLRGSSFARIYN